MYLQNPAKISLLGLRRFLLLDLRGLRVLVLRRVRPELAVDRLRSRPRRGLVLDFLRIVDQNMLTRLDLGWELLILSNRSDWYARWLDLHVLDVVCARQARDYRHGLRGLRFDWLAHRLGGERWGRLERALEREVLVLLQGRLVAQYEASPHRLLDVQLAQQLLVVVHQLEPFPLQQLDLLLQVVLLQLLVFDQLLEEQAELVFDQRLEDDLRGRNRLRPRKVRVDAEIRHRLLHLRKRGRSQLRQHLRLGRGWLHRQLHRLLFDRVRVALQLLREVPQVVQLIL